jgi:hypothetical protein
VIAHILMNIIEMNQTLQGLGSANVTATAPPIQWITVNITLASNHRPAPYQLRAPQYPIARPMPVVRTSPPWNLA